MAGHARWQGEEHPVDLARQEDAARVLLDGVCARAVWHQGVGALQRWSGCDRAQARAWLGEGAGGDSVREQHVEAHRIVEVLDAQAQPRTDLDGPWD
jgi:hypothetical protein